MKRLWFLLFLLGSIQTTFGQWGDQPMQEKPSWQDRMFFGGGLGLSFSQSYDFVSVSPIVGYRLTQKLATGFNFIYRYTKYKYVTPNFSTNDYGISPFLRYQIYGPLFLHAEYEHLNYQYITYSGETFRQSYNSFLAGGGFFQPLGRNAGFFAVALYNFSYNAPGPNDYYPYGSPWILRAGITAGF
jgi:hypothetical protein